jgi:uncharacterized protein (UPF0335 family)
MIDVINADTKQKLKSFVERIERLEEEKRNIADDTKDVMAEAKSFGFDLPTIRKIIRLRKIDSQKAIEQEELLDLYKQALDMA